MQHPNFYENLAEAHMRLRGTVVLYDNTPYYVMAITSHKPDGIFRVYLEETGWTDSSPRKYPSNIIDQYPATYPQLGALLDAWLETPQGKASGILRKQMNSPSFNKFRPFPLGMLNVDSQTYYVERGPVRKSEQGLTQAMTQAYLLSPTAQKSQRLPYAPTNIFSKEFKDCILGSYPTAEECVVNLCDPTVENDAAAFHRSFAFVRGPCELLFLGYKSDIIGVLPKNNFDVVRLGSQFRHCREVVQELRLFNSVV